MSLSTRPPVCVTRLMNGTGLRSDQPPWAFWVIVGVPVLLIGSLVIVEGIATLDRGYVDSSAVVLWVVLVLFATPLTVPILLAPKTVVTEVDGVLVRYYLGRRRKVAWSEFSSIRKRGGGASQFNEAHELVELVPEKGRRIILTDRMTNFHQLIDAIVAHSGTET